MTADVPGHAMVLAAGLGTRLSPLTLVRAKPAIPVAGEPMIRRIVSWLATNGVAEIVINLHHLPHTLTASVGDGSDLGAHVRYSWEQPTVLGSAGGPRRALEVIGAGGAGAFLIVNGDTLTDVDLTALAAAHRASGALVTLALVPNTEPHRYGGVRLGAGGAVAGFVPRGAAAEGSCHFIGVQIASAEVFLPLAPGEPVSSIGGVYDEIIKARPGAIRGFVSNAAFWDVGTPSGYLRTSAAFGGGEPDRGGGQRTRVDPTARIVGSILWDDVEVGPHSRLERCIVTDRVRVPARSTYCDAILLATDEGGVTVCPLVN